MEQEKTIGFLLFEKWHGKENIGSSRIRGHWLIKYWPEAEVFQQGKKYEVVIFQKCYWKQYVELYDGIKILDICDPDWLEGLEVKRVADKCDYITTSTQALADAIKQFTDTPVKYIPDRQDLEFHDYEKYKKIHKGRAKKVIWFGYSHNASVLDKTISTLKKYNLQLIVLSDFRPPYSHYKENTINIKYRWGEPDFDFNKEILRADIVLMPPYDGYKGKFKSPNKIYTAWALGMPVARNKEELVRFLDPDERNKEAKRRLKEVREKYDVRLSVKEFQQIIEEIKKKKHGDNR